jgi:phage tail protein X
MSEIYTTKQGETVDLACRAHYGRTRNVTEIVLASNKHLARLGAVLPMGTRIIMPTVDLKVAARELVKLWD